MSNHAENKMMLLLAAVSVCFFLIMFPCVLLLATGTVTLSISGFAVDQSGRIYIGETNKISVYEDGVIVNTISPKTSRAYIFTINKDDNILLSTSDIVYVMDLNGNVLKQDNDRGADIYNQLSYRKRQFISASGDVYKLKGTLGRTRIVKNDTESVYSISALSYAVKIAVELCVAFVCILAVWSILQRRRDNKVSNL